MILQPTSKEHLTELLRAATCHREQIRAVNLALLNHVLAHTPEDMTARVETGITLAELQRRLAATGQWLPIDPPGPATLTVADLLARNLSGPRRFGFGTIRDHLIGLQVVLPDGRLASSGGNVVKNVAGYDLMKLFIGAGCSLGVPVEATFKLMPRPAAEAIVQSAPGPLDQAEALTQSVLDSPLAPTILDWASLETPASPASATAEACVVILGFAGTAEEVQWQQAEAAKLGFLHSATLDYQARFFAEPAPAGHVSVLPSRLAATVRELSPAAFVARAGNGVLHHRGAAPSGAVPPVSPALQALARRIKETFDPLGLLPGLC